MRLMEATTKRPRGRPKSPEKLERTTLFLPPDVKARVEQYGQEWARTALKKAKPPKPDA